MARSPLHKFGQIIGDVVEVSIGPCLEQIALGSGLYLDRRGRRSARRGVKVSWTDLYGNQHDLDFVLERHGSAAQIGTPVAFVETAYRRYTKHSRNKAQEIQGAILPLVATHYGAAPFIGVVIAGVFTQGAISQLESRGFNVLYFPYDTVVEAFGDVGVNAYYDETTPDTEGEWKVRCWEELTEEERRRVPRSLAEINRPVA